MAKFDEMELHASLDVDNFHNQDHPSRQAVSRDDVDLSRAGKKPVLKRTFGFMGILGFNCLVLNTWGGSLILFSLGFTNGGPAGLFWGFLIVWIGVLATFTSLAELASMAPVSGGQYHWVSMLAPRSSKRLLSFLTGWLTVAGWQGGFAAAVFIAGNMVQGIVQVVKSDYIPQPWHTTMFLYAVVAFNVLVNVLIGSKLSAIESVLLVVYVLGFFGILVPLVYLSPHSSATEVFTTFINSGNWSSQGLSFFVGLSGYAFVFLGSDSGYHMSEEVRNAAVTVPRTIIIGIVIDGVLALSMLIAVLFCLGDADTLLETDYVFPFIEIFMRATGSRAATAVMLALMTFIQLGLSLAVTAAASRQLWAFARDKGVPGWRKISKVNSKTAMPVASIMCTAILSLLIGLIPIGSTVAFNAVISVALCNLYASYFFACALLLWQRMTGRIADRSSSYQNGVDDQAVLSWGPWRVPGFAGTFINGFACIYLLIIFFFSFWPPATPVEPVDMNWASLLFGCSLIFSLGYYAFSARKTYEGPVLEIFSKTSHEGQ